MADNNLNFKNIREFTPDDTLYIQRSSGGHSTTTLCRFVKFERNRVVGISIGEGTEITGAIEKCALFGQLPSEGRTRYHWFDVLGHAAYESAEARHMAVPKEHPSYAMISISRCSTSGQIALFGSSILHSNTVRLKICPAELDRDLHQDRYHPSNKPLIEVEMSSSQFADMLTSPNTMGTPVTLKQLGDDRIDACPFISKIEQFDRELQEKCRNTHAETKQKMANLIAILDQSKMPKKEKEHIARMVSSINTELESNMPFLMSQLAEEMDKVVSEAKGAITAHLHQESQALGIPIPAAPISIE